MVINFITNQSPESVSGGWSGISNHLYKSMASKAEVNLISGIHPPCAPNEKIISKILRSLGLRGKFFFYSDKRLNRIRQEIEAKVSRSDYNFFFGQTPWIKFCSKVPYGVYMDASFPTYLRVFSNPDLFDKEDVKRIMNAEKTWLLGATHLFWGSEWAKKEAENQYHLNHTDQTVVWTGGNIDIPAMDCYKGEFIFLFISLRFMEKGGFVAAKAFERVKAKFPQALLYIIGEEPPGEILKMEGIHFVGKLNKSVPYQKTIFESLLGRAFCLVHPTVMDTMGAVIIEAGYFGCPAIAPKSFGIPELIKDKETGILLELPFNEEDVAKAMFFLLENRELYMHMRIKVREHCVSHLTYKVMAEKIIAKIREFC